jgi:hypothetical protein
VPDKHGFIRGDTPSSPGDSGGGIFSLEVGCLCLQLACVTSTSMCITARYGEPGNILCNRRCSCCLQTGKLLGICVGREKIKGEDGQFKDGFKSVLVPVTGVLMLCWSC